MDFNENAQDLPRVVEKITKIIRRYGGEIAEGLVIIEKGFPQVESWNIQNCVNFTLNIHKTKEVGGFIKLSRRRRPEHIPQIENVSHLVCVIVDHFGALTIAGIMKKLAERYRFCVNHTLETKVNAVLSTGHINLSYVETNGRFKLQRRKDEKLRSSSVQKKTMARCAKGRNTEKEKIPVLKVKKPKRKEAVWCYT